MNPDRWRRIEEIYQGAVERPPDERVSFVDEASNGDRDLQIEVMELLARAADATAGLRQPLIEVIRGLAPARAVSLVGRTIGTYRIDQWLGSGGMGDVYRARDSKLGRDVALKILPASFTSDPEGVARFRREAQILASLNHPHIAQIHGLDESDGTQFLVLELVDGESLDKRIARGRIPVDEALGIAKQIAEALEAAHEKGIIHRDLKPANIALTKDGQVKVLDFGLAKATESTSSSIDLSMPPTITPPAVTTGVGVILGTAAYMSPEQVRGKPLDKRTDVWSFGVVVFEMLTGQRAFAGDEVSDTLAAVITRDLNWSALPPDTRLSVRRLLRRCLERDRTRRLADIADARLELSEPDEIDSPSAVTGERSRRRMPVWMFPAAGVVLTALAFVAGEQISHTGTMPLQMQRVEINLPVDAELYGSSGGSLAISPDGSTLAIVLVRKGVRQTYLRRIDQREFTPLRGTENSPIIFFSPDGAALGVKDTFGTIRKLSLADGGVETIATRTDVYSGGCWLPSGQFVAPRNGQLWTFTHAAGAMDPAARPLTTPVSAAHETYRWPVCVPNRPLVLFASGDADPDSTRIEVVSAATGERHVVVDHARYPLYASGHLMFMRNNTLMAVPVDEVRMEPTGPATTVIENLPPRGIGGAMVALSANGTLVYGTSTANLSHLVSVSREGAEEPVNLPSREYGTPRYAPDGHRIIVDADQSDIWLLDTGRGAPSRLSVGTPLTSFPVWMSDGRRIALRSAIGVQVVSVDGTGSSQVIRDTTVTDYPTDVSPDGRTLALTRLTQNGTADMYGVPPDGGGKAYPMVRTSAYEGGGHFSPDGHWLAFASNESGRMEVYLQAFPNPTRRWTVSTAGGVQPIFRRDGRELFYRTGDKLMAVEISGGNELSLGTPRMLFERRYVYGNSVTNANWDVAPDGKHFVMLSDDGIHGQLSVVFNWFAELNRGRTSH